MRRIAGFIALAVLWAGAGSPAAESTDYLPDAAGAREVSVAESGPASAAVEIATLGLATKENGPAPVVKKFGELYGFLPAFFAVRKDEPTRVTFWNLQPDDEHDFMLLDPEWNVLMHERLPPAAKTSWVFTFHRAGLYRFYCAMHSPLMSGQILVLESPPARRRP